jgi:uncharacterized protein with GYD domain
MATYATLYRFTDQGIQNVKESPDRLAGAIKQGKKFGVKVLSAHYLQGSYDLVVISEAKDDDMAAAFALAIAAQGNVQSTTMRAWSAEDFKKVVAKMP